MKIAIIGAGNIGGAIARGLSRSGRVRERNITAADQSELKLNELKADYAGINITMDNHLAVKDADLIIVAVKPWLVEQVLTDLKISINYDTQSVMSVAAGVTFEMLSKYLDKDGKLPVMFRIIPNTAITLGQSVTFIANEGAKQEMIDAITEMFSDLGLALTVDENQMLAGTSLASCGIAFALKYLDSSIKGGEKLGFSSEESRDIVMQTMRGALELLEHNGSMPQTEIDKVTTPGGVTLKGLDAMAQAGFHEAVLAGLEKSR